MWPPGRPRDPGDRSKIEMEFDVGIPSIGRATETEDGSLKLLRLGIDQLFCLIESEKDSAKLYFYHCLSIWSLCFQINF